jgi:hypothetical protein
LPGTVKIALHLAGRIGKSKHRSNRFAYPLRIAFQIAGRIGSTAGSPNPAGGLFDFRIGHFAKPVFSLIAGWGFLRLADHCRASALYARQ